MKRFNLSVLVLALSLALQGCSMSPAPPPATPEPTPEPEPEPVVITETECTEILFDGKELVPLCYSGSCFYCSSHEKTGENIPEKVLAEAKRKKITSVNDGRYDVFSPAIYKVSPNGRVARLPEYSSVPPEENTGNWKDFSSVVTLDSLRRKADGTFVAIEHTASSGNSVPADKTKLVPGKNYLEYVEHYYLRTLDKNGADLLTREISANEAKAMTGDSSFSSSVPAEDLELTDFGITKTMLCSEIHPLNREQGYRFLSGSFDSSTRKYSYELVTVKFREAGKEENYPVLRLACRNSSPRLQEAVAAFNRESAGKAIIRIFVSDEPELPADADLLYLSVPESHSLAADGRLTNLYGFMENDKTVQPSSFMQNILEAAEFEGGLYCTCSGFGISTLIGAASVTGNRCSWNYDDFRNAWWSLGQGTDAFPLYYTADEVYAFCSQMDRNLMTPEEEEQLKAFCSNFPASYQCFAGYPGGADSSDLRVRSKRQMLLPAELLCFDDLVKLGYEFGEEISYVGWPTLHGTGSTVTISTLDPGMNLAVSSSCRDPEAAWSFLRTFFTASYLNEMSDQGRFFPSRYSCFNRGLNSVMSGEFAVDKNGDVVLEDGKRIFVSLGTMYLSDFTEVRYYPVSEQRAENFRMLAESVTKLAADF